MNKNLLAAFAVIAALLTTGCASNIPSASQLRQISLGMSRNEVVSALGEPAVVRGSIRNKFDDIIEVWEYKLSLPSSDSAGQVAGKAALTVLTLGIAAREFATEKKNYWLYFQDSKLVQWGEAGDWKKEPERIYEYNFGGSPKVPQT